MMQLQFRLGLISDNFILSLAESWSNVSYVILRLNLSYIKTYHYLHRP
nr:MAG TPA: hypothetical protein [Caudoviricetes sp.]